MNNDIQDLMANVLGCTSAEVPTTVNTMTFDELKQAFTSSASTGTYDKGGTATAFSPKEKVAVDKVLEKLNAQRNKTQLLFEKNDSDPAMKELARQAETFVLGAKFDTFLDNADTSGNGGSDPIQTAVVTGSFDNMIPMSYADITELAESQEVVQVLRVILRNKECKKLSATHHYGHITLVIDIPSKGVQRVNENSSIILLLMKNQQNALRNAMHAVDGTGVALKAAIEALEKMAKGTAPAENMEYSLPECFMSSSFEQRIAGKTVYTTDNMAAFNAGKKLGSKLCSKNPISKRVSTKLFHMESGYTFTGLGEGSDADGFAQSKKDAVRTAELRAKREELVFAADLERANAEHGAKLIGVKIKSAVGALKDLDIDGLDMNAIVGQMINIG